MCCASCSGFKLLYRALFVEGASAGHHDGKGGGPKSRGTLPTGRGAPSYSIHRLSCGLSEGPASSSASRRRKWSSIWAALFSSSAVWSLNADLPCKPRAANWRALAAFSRELKAFSRSSIISNCFRYMEFPILAPVPHLVGVAGGPQHVYSDDRILPPASAVLSTVEVQREPVESRLKNDFGAPFGGEK
jgi:hypothetical protein